MVLFFFFFFFFKQKTAYEMLSGDWSSDVCSSDLVREGAVLLDALHLERGAHDDRLPDRREDDGDEPLAAARVVPGEVLVVGARRGDQAVELAAVELGLGALDAAGKNLRS